MAGVEANAEEWLRRTLRSAGRRSTLADATAVWVGRNGTRVDGRFRDDTGRQHHVVAVGYPDHGRIATTIHEPPAMGPHPPAAVVVNGPSGSGKSTLLAALQQTAPGLWVTFDEPVLGQVHPGFVLWPERAPHLHRGFLDGIGAVARSGVRVGIAAGGLPQEAFRAALTDLAVTWVGLHCPAALLAERERGRSDRWGGLAEQSSGAHDAWAYDLEIDTDRTSPGDAARQVLALVEQ